MQNLSAFPPFFILLEESLEEEGAAGCYPPVQGVSEGRPCSVVGGVAVPAFGFGGCLVTWRGLVRPHSLIFCGELMKRGLGLVGRRVP